MSKIKPPISPQESVDAKHGHYDDPIVGMHYKLCAYVCGKGCTKPSPFEGWATFTQIFNSRPDGCRYAVAQRVPLLAQSGTTVSHGEPSGPYVVWDLLDDLLVKGKRTAPSGLLMPPPPVWLGDSEDGMIMKAMALYEQP